MAPLRSTLGRSVGRLLGIRRTNDLAGVGDGGAAEHTQLNSRYKGGTRKTSFEASGGSKVTSGDYTYHIFTSPDTFELSEELDCDILVVAGGGGGGDGSPSPGPGGQFGGGGGAGGIAYAENFPVNTSPHPVSVGEGGTHGDGGTPGQGSDGGNTTFQTAPSPMYILAKGGGGGGGCKAKGSTGGSSGGAGRDYSGSADSGTQPGTNPSPLVTDYGNDGTGGSSSTWCSGGGAGGAGGNGVAGTPGGQPDGPGGTGGPGQAFPAFPGPVLGPAIPAPVRPAWLDAVTPTGLFGGGGGSSTLYATPVDTCPYSPDPFYVAAINTGGSGGGGRGALGGNPSPQPAPTVKVAEAGTSFTGGGGGGGSTPWGDSMDGKDGGDGIVIVRYTNP